MTANLSATLAPTPSHLSQPIPADVCRPRPPSPSLSVPGSPVRASTPKRPKPKARAPTPTPPGRQLRRLNVNCNSISSKRGSFQHLVDTHDPDIVVATETKLTSSINNGEIGAPDQISAKYNIFREDRNAKNLGGGVMIAVKSEIASSIMPNLDTDCEILWVQISLKVDKNIIIGGFYHPHTANSTSCDAFETALQRLPPSATTNLWIAGDFNLPDIDWRSNSMKKDASNVGIQRRFQDIFDDAGLTQMITEPTRANNTLDLFLTNNETLISNWKVVEGISDHDKAVLIDGLLPPHRLKQTPRQIPLYKKADWSKMEHAMDNVYNELRAKAGSTVEMMWTSLKNALSDAISANIPHKTARRKDQKPWITNPIRKLMKKSTALSKRKHKNNYSRQDSQKHRELRAKIQKKIRQSYWIYIEDILTPNTNSMEDRTKANKRFWTLIKHTKWDSIGIPQMKSPNGDTVVDSQGRQSY
ncbi:uncharacterized protein LOC135487880 [Lineus longissimus]|uniref:uncharacterized protein LOC135487880 n=1 Tax=Lineus longissimus TaxID=88925 RepID=UPI00315CECAE